MYFSSTRGGRGHLTAEEAIVRGLAADGGLLVPSAFPELVFDDFMGQDYLSLAQTVLSRFLPDFEDLPELIRAAYGQYLPVGLQPMRETLGILELFHGKTSAFKDVALQLLPYLLTESLRKLNEQRQAVILTATSGDTGSAVMSGFSDVPGTRVIVFYPDEGISETQRLQMTTQTGPNVTAIAIKGNFDDAQRVVKELFMDQAFQAEFVDDFIFTSANSINFGRLVPQIVYYFWVYSELVKKGRFEEGASLNFAVPTGNFGNILAGYYAKRMGLPVGKLICATNRNSVLYDFFTNGVYDRERDFYVTNSPSMDILVSSNFERLLYHLTNAVVVRRSQDALESEGSFSISPRLLARLREDFAAYKTDDLGTERLIRAVNERSDYILDPHTAVAYGALADYQKTSGDENYGLVLATASPYKFPATVEKAIGRSLDEAETPENLRHLKELEIMHKELIEPQQASEAIRKVLKKG